MRTDCERPWYGGVDPAEGRWDVPEATGEGTVVWDGRSSNSSAACAHNDLTWRVSPLTVVRRGTRQDDDNVKDALRYSAAMLAELRTSTLGPQRYYEMYMQVSDQLHFLQVGSAMGGGREGLVVVAP